MKRLHRICSHAVFAVALSGFSIACSSTDASDPIDSPDPSVPTRIELVTREGASTGLVDGDTLRVTARVLDHRGDEVLVGVVTWKTTASILTSDSRTVLIRLPAGAIEVRATLDPGGGRAPLSKTIAVAAAPRIDKAFLWTAVGGTMEIAPPAGALKFVPVDINDSGQVLGTAHYPVVGTPPYPGATSVRRAFIWSPERGYVEIGNFPAGTDVNAGAITESGAVTGYANTILTVDTRSFVWTERSGITFPISEELAPNGSIGTGINRNEAIAGTLFENRSLPFRWNRETGLTLLPIRSGCGMVAAINDAGDVLGFEGSEPNWSCLPSVFVLWDNAGERIEIDKCISSCRIAVTALNNHRAVTGSRGGTAFRWYPTAGFQTMGFEEAIGYDINEIGDVVGALSYGETYPFLWTITNRIIDIPLLAGTVSGRAVAINNKGQVIGTAR